MPYDTRANKRTSKSRGVKILPPEPRKPKPLSIVQPIESPRIAPTYEILGHSSIYSLLRAFACTLHTKDVRKWHLVYPARGYLRGIGDVVILATDDMLALFWDGSNILLDGHKHNFDGPIGRTDPDTEPKEPKEPKADKDLKPDTLKRKAKQTREQKLSDLAFTGLDL